MSLKSPEAVKYFSSFDNKFQNEPEIEVQSKFEVRPSKQCRIATNKMQFMSLSNIVGQCSKTQFEYNRMKTLKNIEKEIFMKKIAQVASNPHGNMLEQIAKKRNKLDIPLSLEDLKYGTRKIVGNRELTNLNDKLAESKKKKILDNLKTSPSTEN